MLRVPQLLFVGSTAAALTVATALPATAASDDESRLDAAMQGFNERMTEAGWESQGLPEEATQGTSVEDEDAEDEELTAEDEAFTECMGELGTLFEGGDDAFPGETARAWSEEFTFSPPSDAPETTEAFSFDFDAQEEEASAFAVSVDDASVGTLEDFVEVLGSEQTGECIREALEAEMATDSSDAPIPMEFEMDVTTEGDLGVGEQSARLGFGISANIFGIPLDLDASVLMARVGSDLVAVTHFATGEATSGFDPVAELQALADTVGG